jgi:hypothetical protein
MHSAPGAQKTASDRTRTPSRGQRSPCKARRFMEDRLSAQTLPRTLPCRRSRVRVPSSAYKIPAKGHVSLSYSSTPATAWQGSRVAALRRRLFDRSSALAFLTGPGHSRPEPLLRPIARAQSSSRGFRGHNRVEWRHGTRVQTQRIATVNLSVFRRHPFGA